MENDTKTVPSYFNIVLDGDEKYLCKLKKDADESDQNIEKGDNFLAINHEKHRLAPSEIYFEEGKLHISFDAISKEGSSYISLEVPLSTEVLFDILGDSIKKFNKVKTVLEATK